MDSIVKRRIARWKKAGKELIRCVICNGTGIQEETIKGYRRYNCWSCEGGKMVLNPFPTEDRE